MAAVLWFLFSHTFLILGLVGVAIWLGLRPSSRRARRALIMLVGVFTMASLFAVPHGVRRLLTRGYHPLVASDVPAGRTAIIVLGAGEGWVEAWDRRSLPVVTPMGSSRILEAARAYRLLPNAWLISSGGAAFSAPGAPPSGDVMRDALIRLGLPSDRITVEAESHSTRQQPVKVSPILRSLGADHVVLVTTDVHMYRSLGVFRAAGINAIPAIARDPEQPYDLWLWILPGRVGLELSAAVAHELVGIGYYTARGWMR